MGVDPPLIFSLREKYRGVFSLNWGATIKFVITATPETVKDVLVKKSLILREDSKRTRC